MDREYHYDSHHTGLNNLILRKNQQTCSLEADLLHAERNVLLKKNKASTLGTEPLAFQTPVVTTEMVQTPKSPTQ